MVDFIYNYLRRTEGKGGFTYGSNVQSFRILDGYLCSIFLPWRHAKDIITILRANWVLHYA